MPHHSAVQIITFLGERIKKSERWLCKPDSENTSLKRGNICSPLCFQSTNTNCIKQFLKQGLEMNSVWVSSIPKGHSHHLAKGNAPSCSLSLKNMSKRCFLETSIFFLMLLLSQSKSTPRVFAHHSCQVYFAF